MAELPRTTCNRCGRRVPVRRNGALREHNTSHDKSAPKCENSGEVPPATFADSPGVRTREEGDRG